MALNEKIEGKNVLTVNMKAGDIYPIEYKSIASVNIVNYTDRVIFVSEKDDFTLTNGVGDYLVITDGNSYNEYVFYKAGKNGYADSSTATPFSLYKIFYMECLYYRVCLNFLVFSDLFAREGKSFK